MKPRITWPLVADSGGGGGSYVLPVATSGTLGGVKVETATAEQTQPVGIGADAKLYTEPIPTLVQSDWDETDTTDPAYIANKPTIPEAYTLPIATSSTLGGVTAAVKDTETAEVVVDPYGKLYYEQMHQNQPATFTFIFNATFGAYERLADYEDAMIVKGFVVDVEDDYTSADGEDAEQMLVHVRLLINSIIYNGRDRNRTLEIYKSN